MKPLLLLFGTLLAVAVALGEEPRIWTSSGGSEREAAFVALEGETLVLEVEDRILRTPIGLFSERDQAHARQLAKQQIDSSSDTQPLQVFDGPSFSGREALLETDRIYRGNEIPGQLDAKISSLVLKKGYQLTIGIHEDGSGLSKVLIAIKRDIRIRELSAEFNNRIRYIRVLPWRNVIKKGHGGQGFEGLNEGWYYLWGGMGETTTDIAWTPMAYTQRQSEDPKWITTLVQQKGIQEVLGFNEPDYVSNGKPNRKLLFDPKDSVKAMQPLMTSRLRIGTPNVTQGGPKKWLPQFMAEAEDQRLRIDFVCVHWYDWGNKAYDPDPSPEAVFMRFKKFIEQVYDDYGLPLWITEFNANPHRNPEVQIEFLKLALPYLDACPYVERYAWFQPFGVPSRSKDGSGDTHEMDKSGGSGCFREKRGDTSTPLTEIGRLWRDHRSIPAMEMEVYLGRNNLCKDEKEQE